MTRKQIETFNFAVLAQLINKHKPLQTIYEKEGFSIKSDFWKILMKGEMEFNGKAKIVMLRIFREVVAENKKLSEEFDSLNKKFVDIHKKLYAPTTPLNGLKKVSNPNKIQLKSYIERLEKEINDAHALLDEQKVKSRIEVQGGLTAPRLLRGRIEELIYKK